MRSVLRALRRRARRGVATLVVLVLISISLALSYAIMRAQGTAARIQQNANLESSARQAAMTGAAAALKQMHTSAWRGPSDPAAPDPTRLLRGAVGRGVWFEVRYALGDPSLVTDDPDLTKPLPTLLASHPDRNDFPYRVTLFSTGYATDPADAQRRVSRRVQVVVRLVPRNLRPEPTDWATMQQYTVYQTRDDDFEIDIPCLLEGRLRVQGRLRIAPNYPDNDDAWRRYLEDLNKMRLARLPDYRPLKGPVHLPYAAQEAKHLWALIFRLGVTTWNTAAQAAAADWVKPTGLASYQIYAPGGRAYAIPQLPSTLQDIVLAPDPLTNPLGLYYRDGSLTIRDNVTVRGTLFCKDDIHVEGANVLFEPAELPALAGSTAAIRLPVLTCQNFLAKHTAQGSVTGLVAVFDRFRIDKGPETNRFAFTGRIITRKYFLKEREPWPSVRWQDEYNAFMAQVLLGVKYFPVWMGNRGRNPQPLLTVHADPTPPRYHWHRPGEPVFIPHPDDASSLAPTNPGLRWEVLSWTQPQTGQ